MKIDDELMWNEHISDNITVNVVESALVDGSETKENAGDTTDYGCLMVFFNEKDASNIKQWIDENIPIDVLSDFGIEDEPHVTCQYGFHEDVTIEEITEFLNHTVKKPIEINMGEISRFSNEKHDVIKVDIDSPDLHELSDKIREHFDGRLEVTFPNYHPHMTLAYVSLGALPTIDGDGMFGGKNFVFDEFTYSTSGMEEKFNITRNG